MGDEQIDDALIVVGLTCGVAGLFVLLVFTFVFASGARCQHCFYVLFLFVSSTGTFISPRFVLVPNVF